MISRNDEEYIFFQNLDIKTEERWKKRWTKFEVFSGAIPQSPSSDYIPSRLYEKEEDIPTFLKSLLSIPCISDNNGDNKLDENICIKESRMKKVYHYDTIENRLVSKWVEKDNVVENESDIIRNEEGNKNSKLSMEEKKKRKKDFKIERKKEKEEEFQREKVRKIENRIKKKKEKEKLIEDKRSIREINRLKKIEGRKRKIGKRKKFCVGSDNCSINFPNGKIESVYDKFKKMSGN
jgi:hypothetical protein